MRQNCSLKSHHSLDGQVCIGSDNDSFIQEPFRISERKLFTLRMLDGGFGAPEIPMFVEQADSDSLRKARFVWKPHCITRGYLYPRALAALAQTSSGASAVSLHKLQPKIRHRSHLSI